MKKVDKEWIRFRLKPITSNPDYGVKRVEIVELSRGQGGGLFEVNLLLTNGLIYSSELIDAIKSWFPGPPSWHFHVDNKNRLEVIFYVPKVDVL